MIINDSIIERIQHWSLMRFSTRANIIKCDYLTCDFLNENTDMLNENVVTIIINIIINRFSK